jgi:hypothetical protein
LNPAGDGGKGDLLHGFPVNLGVSETLSRKAHVAVFAAGSPVTA